MTKAVEGVKQDNRLVRYIKETRAELRKVHWPSRKEARNLTLIVLAVTIAMAIFLGLIVDFFFSWLSGGIFTASIDFRFVVLVVLGVAGIAALVIVLRGQSSRSL